MVTKQILLASSNHLDLPSPMLTGIVLVGQILQNYIKEAKNFNELIESACKKKFLGTPS